MQRQQQEEPSSTTVYQEAWDLFRAIQNHMPNSEAVNSAISTHLGLATDWTTDIKQVYRKRTGGGPYDDRI